MTIFICAVLIFLGAGLSSAANASLLDDDSIAYSVDLATSSGNTITTSGTFAPGNDAFCLDFSIFGPCPPGTLFDTTPTENTNGGGDIFLLFNAEAEALSILIADAVVGVPEFITGTVTFSDIGWGDVDGHIVGGEVCGIGMAGCGPASGFVTEFFADAVAIEIDSYLAVFSNSSGNLSAIGQLTADLEIGHVPIPTTVSLLAIALTGIGLLRRK